jgi:hypothetical protein
MPRKVPLERLEGGATGFVQREYAHPRPAPRSATVPTVPPSLAIPLHLSLTFPASSAGAPVQIVEASARPRARKTIMMMKVRCVTTAIDRLSRSLMQEEVLRSREISRPVGEGEEKKLKPS